MKKFAILLSLLLVVGIFVSQAMAGPGWNRGAATGYAQVVPQQQVDPAVRQKFLDETADMRRELAADQAELGALMRADNPDPARVRTLSEKIYTTREQIGAKAEEAGLWNPDDARGFGRGFGRGGCGGPGARGGYQAGFQGACPGAAGCPGFNNAPCPGGGPCGPAFQGQAGCPGGAPCASYGYGSGPRGPRGWN